jgi:beta-lactamase regulating signal transducer with metallopeptidase domain
MKKFFLKYSFIIVVNLLFFLVIWYFLDKYFNTNWKILLWLLVFSIIPLLFISNKMIKKTIKELEEIQKNKNNFKK